MVRRDRTRRQEIQNTKRTTFFQKVVGEVSEKKTFLGRGVQKKAMTRYA